jgi:pimeloyl-ACP methyl ester carboxylesterase
MSRRFVTLMFVFALVAQVLAFSPLAIAQDATPPGDANGSPADGGSDFTVDLRDRTLHVVCKGTGGPTVVQEIGGPDPAGGAIYIDESGVAISSLLGTRFCGYDRAGTGDSPADPAGIRTLSEAGADLLSVLESPELDCPCVVGAESLGGGIALAALAQDSSKFAGLVSLDSLTPGYSEEVLELAPPGSMEAGMAGFFEGDNEEMLDYRMTADMVPAEPPSIPIRVLTHGSGDPPPCPCSADYPVDRLEAAWQQGQTELASELGVEVIIADNTGHFIAEENPELVIGAILDVIAEIEAGGDATPVAQRR